MFIAFCRFLFRLRGWKLVDHPEVSKEELARCVLIAAPHTSNWDAIYTFACFDMLGVDWRFTIKKEWLKPPFGGLLKSIGAIGIDRTPKKEGEKRPSMVEAMADLFRTHKKLCIVFTPEGTRQKVTQWKTGFYYAAKLANVPVGLGYMDYEKKEAGIAKMIYPSENIEHDLKKIMDFYKTISGRFPSNFSLDERYS